MNEGARIANEQMFRNSIESKLDKIIELLRLYLSIEQAGVGLIMGEGVRTDYILDFKQIGLCNCSQKGKTSAVVTCPIHG